MTFLLGNTVAGQRPTSCWQIWEDRGTRLARFGQVSQGPVSDIRQQAEPAQHRMCMCERARMKDRGNCPADKFAWTRPGQSTSDSWTMSDNQTNESHQINSADRLSQQILDSLTAEVAVLDQDGTIVAVNKAWQKFAVANGGSEETTGVGVNYLDVCGRASGEDALAGQLVRQGIEDVLNGADEVFKFEYPCHSDDRRRWFLLYVSRLDKSDSFVVTTHLPITERKLTEQRLVVAERLGAIGQAMQGLSHEGRNALQRAQAHMALLRFHVEDNPEALELIGKIEKAQEKLLDLYEDVKSYAKPISLHCQSCRIDKLAEKEWTKFQLASRPAQFSFVNNSTDPTCKVDAETVARVLQEVFKNAVAACPDAPQIELACNDDVLNGHAAVTLVVSDNGSGVPTEEREQAFQLFSTIGTHGTGLGLAWCKRIIAAHFGRIQFETPRLGGASISITLPRQRSIPRVVND